MNHRIAAERLVTRELFDEVLADRESIRCALEAAESRIDELCGALSLIVHLANQGETTELLREKAVEALRGYENV